MLISSAIGNGSKIPRPNLLLVADVGFAKADVDNNINIKARMFFFFMSFFL
ncbi:hypothetical protein BHO_0900004 [Borrelia hermsii YBT]|nr:hypothetical protein BHO_0900004 [Borrelia hermsii YBT]